MNPEQIVGVIDTRAVVGAAARTFFVGEEGRPLLDGARRVGTLYESAEAFYCYLDELVPEDTEASPGEQTRSIFRQIENGLATAGMEFDNLIRTWFFLDHILDWYDEFNQARTPFLKEHGIACEQDFSLVLHDTGEHRGRDAKPVWRRGSCRRAGGKAKERQGFHRGGGVAPAMFGARLPEFL